MWYWYSYMIQNTQRHPEIAEAEHTQSKMRAAVPLITLLVLPADALLAPRAAITMAPRVAHRAPVTVLGSTRKRPQGKRPLDLADDVATSRIVRLANHATLVGSLAYFGLVSSTMQLPGARMPMATLASVITQRVGPTTNAQFSTYFSTLVTPAPYVFLIWPFIAAVQALTVAISILRPGILRLKSPQNSLEALKTIGKGKALSQTELASLSLANAAATVWLFVSSNSLPGALPLLSCLILPFVPFFAAYPLRASPFMTPPEIYRPVFQIFSSFTAIASCLAVAVELQYGGRIGFFAGRPELCGSIFLALVGALVSLPARCLARRTVTTFALSGILARRLQSGAGASLLLSPTFLGTGALFAWSLQKLFSPDAADADSSFNPQRFGF